MNRRRSVVLGPAGDQPPREHNEVGRICPSLILAQHRTCALHGILISSMRFETTDWGKLGAAATLVALPVIVLILFVQRHRVEGFSVGAVNVWWGSGRSRRLTLRALVRAERME